jgi:flagellin-like hook-associated protein FlgL
VNDLITISGSASNNGAAAYVVTAIGGGNTQFTVRSAATITDGALSFAAGAHGGLSFDTAAGTITAATASSLTNIKVGDTISVSGSVGNNGDYVVLSNNGTTLSVAATTTLATQGYYKGDTQVLSQRVDRHREVEYGITAASPVVDKIMRALGLIAQGTFGTAGGLDKNTARIDQALYLLNDAIQGPAAGTAPFGTETRADFSMLQLTLGTTQYTVKQTNERLKPYVGFLENSIGEIEGIDSAEAITKLLDTNRVLEASYQSLAQIRSFSLMDFIN